MCCVPEQRKITAWNMKCQGKAIKLNGAPFLSREKRDWAQLTQHPVLHALWWLTAGCWSVGTRTLLGNWGQKEWESVYVYLRWSNGKKDIGNISRQTTEQMLVFSGGRWVGLLFSNVMSDWDQQGASVSASQACAGLVASSVLWEYTLVCRLMLCVCAKHRKSVFSGVNMP